MDRGSARGRPVPRRTPRLAPRLAAWLAVVLALAAAQTAGAQATRARPADSPALLERETALLERGPLTVKGIPFLPSNVLPAYWAEYRVAGDPAEVWYTRQPLVLPAAWPKLRCGAFSLLLVPVDAGLVVCFAGPLQEGEPAVYLFFSYASGEPASWCGWVEAFLQRFRYLLAFAASGTEVPFPAVLEYRRK